MIFILKKILTYGTYDVLHRGHINLLRRAKERGDYLIVGVTADDFDKTRGKINVQQTLIERIEAVKATEYEEYKPPVDGVVWVHPTTTLVADTPDAIIEATYNRDINKAFAELQNALLSMGGNI